MAPGLEAQLEKHFRYAWGQADYLCNIGKEHGFLYFETPKVACSSIKRSLQRLELAPGGQLPEPVHDKARSPLAGAAASGWSFDEIFRSPRLFRFSFVRNPYARVLSCYLEKIVADPAERARHQQWLGLTGSEPASFLDCLRALERIAERERDIHWRSQAALLNDRAIHYHFIGRFEFLERDFRYALRQFGVEGEAAALQDLSHHRTGAQARLREFYGPEELALARRIYWLDFVRYGYSLQLPGASVLSQK